MRGRIQHPAATLKTPISNDAEKVENFSAGSLEVVLRSATFGCVYAQPVYSSVRGWRDRKHAEEVAYTYATRGQLHSVALSLGARFAAAFHVAFFIRGERFGRRKAATKHKIQNRSGLVRKTATKDVLWYQVASLASRGLV
ncbi:hypothetical protein MRX96_015131 [Rhipicephalus microplus]